jgi:hypothetical protein
MKKLIILMLVCSANISCGRLGENSDKKRLVEELNPLILQDNDEKFLQTLSAPESTLSLEDHDVLQNTHLTRMDALIAQAKILFPHNEIMLNRFRGLLAFSGIGYGALQYGLYKMCMPYHSAQECAVTPPCCDESMLTRYSIGYGVLCLSILVPYAMKHLYRDPTPQLKKEVLAQHQIRTYLAEYAQRKQLALEKP